MLPGLQHCLCVQYVGACASITVPAFPCVFGMGIGCLHPGYSLTHPSLGQVAGLFHDPSIGNPIHITVVRLVLLEDEEVRGAPS